MDSAWTEFSGQIICRPVMSQLAAEERPAENSTRKKRFFIMITHSTTSPSRHALVRRQWRAAVATAALMLAGSSLAYPVIAHADYDQDEFKWCMENLGLGKQYCCEQAGGVLSGGTSGACGAPPITVPPQTITQTPGPPIFLPVPQP